MSSMVLERWTDCQFGRSIELVWDKYEPHFLVTVYDDIVVVVSSTHGTERAARTKFSRRIAEERTVAQARADQRAAFLTT